MPTYLVSYEKEKKPFILERLSKLHGYITYDSSVISLICFCTQTVDIERVIAIDGVYAVDIGSKR